MLYRVKISKHVRKENGKKVTYHVGEEFIPTQAELIAFGDKLEPSPGKERRQVKPKKEKLVQQTVFDAKQEPKKEKPTAEKPKKETLKVTRKGSWYYFPDGSKLLGRERAEAKAEELGMGLE